jgi:hypothetical protein
LADQRYEKIKEAKEKAKEWALNYEEINDSDQDAFRSSSSSETLNTHRT